MMDTIASSSPKRWLGNLPASSNAVPGLWANVMTFSGGPRSCIGYKFAILESVPCPRS